MFLTRHPFLFLCTQNDSKFVNSLFWFDNDFEIESKYHRKISCLVVLAHILSSQDVIFRSMFFLIDYTILGNKRMFKRSFSQHFSFFTGGVNFSLRLVTSFNTSKSSHLVSRPG